MAAGAVPSGGVTSLWWPRYAVIVFPGLPAAVT